MRACAVQFGICVREGRRDTRDECEALAWYLIASATGSKDAAGVCQPCRIALAPRRCWLPGDGARSFKSRSVPVLPSTLLVRAERRIFQPCMGETSMRSKRKATIAVVLAAWLSRSWQEAAGSTVRIARRTICSLTGFQRSTSSSSGARPPARSHSWNASTAGTWCIRCG